MPTNSPRPLVARVFEVLAAGGQGIEITNLIRRMNVTIIRAQRYCQGVVVDGSRAVVAANEAHRRPAIALAGEEQEVADDHAEVIQVPVQHLKIFRRLQNHMPKPLYPRRLPGRALGGVRAPNVVADIEGVRQLMRKSRMLACPSDHPHGETARISEVDREAADRFGQRSNSDAGDIGKASQVGFVGSLQRHPRRTAKTVRV